MVPFHDALDGGFYFLALFVQFPDDADGMPEFQRLGRHNRANVVRGGVPEDERHIRPYRPLEASVRSNFISPGNLRGPRKLI